MRVALGIMICLHGIIHLFGFLKAYRIAEFKGINQPVSKISGLVWLLTSLLFVVTNVLFFVHADIWWAFGLGASIVSQVLIFNFWSDTKYGTIPNIIILAAALLTYVNNDFEHMIIQERSAMFEKSSHGDKKILGSEDISSLPSIVQKWLNHSRVIDKPAVSNIFLTQVLQLRLKPEQEEWNSGNAQQYFTIQPPAFNWNIDTEMNPIMRFVGRDKFENGQGEMLIKLCSIIPVADEKNDQKINQAALQRYLAEIIWFPSAALSDYIQWEEIDENSASATMDFGGTKGAGVFHFDEKGAFKKFVAMRFKDPNDIEPMEWIVIASKTEERNGIKIPIECEVIWNLESGPWTWLKLRIEHIEYNVEKMPVANSARK